jgi:ribosomal protein S1
MTNQEAQPNSITDLEPKMKLQGTVKKVGFYGAFVDIGVGRDGMVHISELSNEHVEKVSDIVKEGDEVTVWVISADPDEGRIGLTMVEPPDVTWRDLAKGQSFTGQINRIERYGVFVDFGAERPGLLHVREMGRGYIRHPSEVFSMGDEVEVRILEVDRRRKRIDLTLVDLTQEAYYEDEDEGEESMPTQMEFAFRRAQKEEARRRRKQSKSKKRQRSEQDDILSRTLQRHEDKS